MRATRKSGQAVGGTPLMALHGDPSAAETVNDLVMSNVRLLVVLDQSGTALDPPAIKRLGGV